MMEKSFSAIRKFILPGFDRYSVIRLLVIVISAACICLLFKPCIISGSSMEPNWNDRQFTVSFRWRYDIFPLRRGDVVTISYFGKTQLLKRVIGLPGDVIEFKNGQLLVNGEEQRESYVKFSCDWEMAPVKVREGHCFVVGDNRSQKIFEHMHGEVELNRITGGPLF